MPQLSPMLGFLMSICTLSAFIVLAISLKQVSPMILPTKLEEASKSSLRFF